MKELSKGQLNVNSVYAVQYVVDEKKYPGRCAKQRGLVVTDASGKIFRSWNIVRPDQWVEGNVELYKKHKVYPATEMEEQFARDSHERDTYKMRCHKMADMNAEQRKQLDYYTTDKWHKVAERVNIAFGRRKA